MAKLVTSLTRRIADLTGQALSAVGLSGSAERLSPIDRTLREIGVMCQDPGGIGCTYNTWGEVLRLVSGNPARFSVWKDSVVAVGLVISTDGKTSGALSRLASAAKMPECRCTECGNNFAPINPWDIGQALEARGISWEQSGLPWPKELDGLISERVPLERINDAKLVGLPVDSQGNVHYGRMSDLYDCERRIEQRRAWHERAFTKESGERPRSPSAHALWDHR